MKRLWTWGMVWALVSASLTGCTSMPGYYPSGTCDGGRLESYPLPAQAPVYQAAPPVYTP